MQTTPQPPIIIDENGDIELYASLREAALALEAIDVLNEEYEAFDRTGQILRLTAASIDAPVVISSDLSAGPAPGQLKERLRGLAERLGPEKLGCEKVPAAMSLDDLVNVLARFFGI